MKNKKLSKWEREVGYSRLEPYLDEMLHGILLSDGHIRRVTSTANANFYFGQTYERKPNKAYYNWIAKHFSPYISMDAFKVKVAKKHETAGFNKSSYEYTHFSTMQLPCFNYYRELYYNNKGIKEVPLNIIDHLTPLALAHWIMGDGSFSGNLRLICRGLGPDGVKLLSSVLLEKFGFKNGISSQNDINVSSSCTPQLVKLVKPFIVDEMLYKIGIGKYSLDTNLPSKRVVLPLVNESYDPLAKLPGRLSYKLLFWNNGQFKIPLVLSDKLSIEIIFNIILAFGNFKHKGILLVFDKNLVTDIEINVLLLELNKFFKIINPKFDCTLQNLNARNNFGIYIPELVFTHLKSYEISSFFMIYS